MDIATLLDQERTLAETIVREHIPGVGEFPLSIHEAIQYSVLNGGKRLRPIIMFASARALGLPRELVGKAACAVEYIHCCSLVLDDLPSMDDAMTRRGRPAVHRVYGVATAILSADALLVHAFKLVADNGIDVGADGPVIGKAIRDLAMAVGSYGMAGGQQVDLESTAGETVDTETIEYILTRKTGALFIVAATLGGTLLGAGPRELATLEAYAHDLGLAYQIVDDILDAEGDEDVVGKDLHQDDNKATFVTVHGVDAARKSAERLVSSSRESLRELDGDTALLDGIAVYCLERSL